MAVKKKAVSASKKKAKPRKVKGELVHAEKPIDSTPAVVPGWPPNLSEDEGNALFDELELGTPRTKAPAKVGLAYRTVFRWLKQHKDFAERFMESEQLGYESIVDTFPDIAASARDKDSAAAARAKADILHKYLQLKAPKQYNVRMLQHGLAGKNGEGEGGAEVVGIIIVPAKESGRGMAPSNDVPGLGTVIVPAKAAIGHDAPAPE